MLIYGAVDDHKLRADWELSHKNRLCEKRGNSHHYITDHKLFKVSLIQSNHLNDVKKINYCAFILCKDFTNKYFSQNTINAECCCFRLD